MIIIKPGGLGRDPGWGGWGGTQGGERGGEEHTGISVLSPLSDSIIEKYIVSQVLSITYRVQLSKVQCRTRVLYPDININNRLNHRKTYKRYMFFITPYTVM